MDTNKVQINPQIEKSWKEMLLDDFSSQYFIELKTKLLLEKKNGKEIYPKSSFIFNAYNSTPFNQVKVVIIGQDPYHGIGQAHGLSFSVPKGIKQPPSLVNIIKELETDLNITCSDNGDLSKWAAQGVLLLNSILTVEANNPASHKKIGWGKFTDSTIKKISENKFGIIFLLWGKFAHEKANLIDSQKHHILKAAHPSPFSAHKGFFGSSHFSKTNKILRENGSKEIEWQI